MKPGDCLQDRYTIEAQLAQGPLYTTYRARDAKTKTLCLIKEAVLARVPDLKSIELIDREAQILQHIEHDRIPRVTATFSTGKGAEQCWYLVRNWVKGKSLAEVVAGGRRLNEVAALAFAADMAGILEYLHSFSPAVVHRDIKPGNIILDDVGKPFLIDFDAIRNVLDQDPAMSGLTVVGTHGYMPFEQYSGQAIEASDIYALGLTMIAAMCGVNPLDMKQQGHSTLWQEHVNVSPHMQHLLRRMTEPKASRRIQNGAQLLREIQRVQAGQAPALPVAKRNLAIGLTLAALIIGGVRFSYWRAATADDRSHAQYESDLQQEHIIRRKFSTTVDQPVIDFDVNLLANPSLEGPAGWDFNPPLTDADTFSKKHATDGEYCLALLRDGFMAYQVIDVSELADDIDAGGCRLFVTAQMKSKTGTWKGSPYFFGSTKEALGGGGHYLSASSPQQNKSWQEHGADWEIPRGTRFIQMGLHRASKGKSNRNVAYFDDVSLWITGN